MKYDIVIFDFDGTLADAENIMQQSLNSVAEQFGFQPIHDAEKEALRRMSARTFLVRRLGIPLWNLSRIASLVRKTRQQFTLQASEVKIFPGISDVLHKLDTAGYTIGIVSTNSVSNIQLILGDLNTCVDFIRRGSTVFGKSYALRSVLKQYKVKKSSVVYVGDELRDVRTCRTVGISMIGVAWGLNDKASLEKKGITVASTPQELFSMITAH